MAFVTPTDVTVGSVLTASKYNQEVVENTSVLPRVISSGVLTHNASISIGSAATYAQIEISLIARSDRSGATNDNIYLRFNGDTGSNYDTYYQIDNATAATRAEARGATTAVIGFTPAANATESNFASYRVLIVNPGATTAFKNVVVNTGFAQSTASANIFTGSAFVQWRNTSAITSILFGSANSAAFVTGSTYSVIGYPFA
jgi:hypothetical protein